MSLSIGIVGLPNVGKSTLFNALLKRQAALAANYPFATIEPNVGVVDVPDSRLSKLADLVKLEYTPKGSGSENARQIPEKIIPAVVKFYDIAGLVSGASQGEGLGNKFLSHIREVDAIVQVVRNFKDENVIRAGAISPISDIKTINTELILADLDTLTKRISKHEGDLKKNKTPENIKKAEIYNLLLTALNAGSLARSLDFSTEDLLTINDLNLLTIKPMIYILNVDESEVNKDCTQNLIKDLSVSNLWYKTSAVLQISAKIESELSSLSENDQVLFMQDLGLTQSGLDKIIKEGFTILGLQTYLTAGPKEVRAWTIKKGDKAPQAAGVIHTDFERGFISAEVVGFDELVLAGGWRQSKDKGLIRIEGKEYVMRDGDVVEFRFSV